MPGKLYNAMNEQVNQEMYSAYLYLSIALWFEEQSLNGFGHWMREQFREEQDHAMRFVTFLQDMGQHVQLQAVAQPLAEFKSPLLAFEQALKHERHITSLIHGLCELADQEKNRPAQEFLLWFVKEQVEEERSVGAVMDKLKLAADSGPATLMLDRELGRREE